MSTARPQFLRAIGAAAAAVALLGTLSACGSAAASGNDSAAATTSSSGSATTTVNVADLAGAPFTATKLDVPTVDTIRAELPAAFRDKGELVIGVGALPSGFPPLAFVGTDQTTLTGSEPDLGRLVAAVLGLKPVINNSTWDNLFVGIDGGRNDVGFTNITDTEKRKEKYDFASYRQDNLGFEVKATSDWNFNGDYKNLAGKTVAVSSGTNQEKILLEWKTKLESEGKTLLVSYFPDTNSTYLALNSGRDASFGPNPSIAYHVSQDTGKADATRNAGTYSGAGASLQGLIAATTKKGNGLAKPVADAINYLIKNGQYDAWLKAYNLSNEAVKASEINPPGLPITNS
jgi:polar amino acid transport system substrate-binding protein